LSTAPLSRGRAPAQPAALRWGRGLRRVGSPLLLALLVWALVALFIGVAQRAVLQGQERQAAQALKNESQWRCRALRPVAARLRCLALLRERPPSDAASLQALLDEAAAGPAPR
jgi:hypothetical protein